MSQHDYNIANASFPTVRTDINNVLSAINSTNSGSSRPSSAVAGTIWLDTSGAATAQLLKLYDGADDILLGTVNFTANTVDWTDSAITLGANSVDSDQYVDGSIDTIHIGDSQITLAKMASGTDGNIISYDASGDPVAVATGTSGQVLTSAGAGSPPTFEAIPAASATNPYRNIIINGDMSIAQRATSATGLTGTGYNTIDRYNIANTGQGTWTQTQETDVPTGQGFANSLKMDCTTADASPAVGDLIVVQQKIEGQNLQYLKKGTANAESLTASFWVKSNKTGTYIINIYDNDNTRSISKSYTIDSASTWEKKTLTFSGDTSGALGNDNGASLNVSFYLGAGTNYTSGTLQTSWGAYVASDSVTGQVNLADSTSNDWYITGVQLEAGTSASDFEFLPVDVNLGRCQRYFQKSYDLGTAVGTATDVGVYWTGSTADAAGNASFLPSYKTALRSSPTLTGYARDGTSGQGSYFRSGASGNGTLNSHMRGQMSSSVYIATGGSAYSTATIASHVTLDSEL